MLCDDLEGWDGGGVGGMLKREGMYGYIWLIWASLVPQLVKNLSAMQETWVQCLGWEDTLEKGMTTPSSILAWRIREWVAMSSSRGSSQPRGQNCVSYVYCIGRWVLLPLAPSGKPLSGILGCNFPVVSLFVFDMLAL